MMAQLSELTFIKLLNKFAEDNWDSLGITCTLNPKPAIHDDPADPPPPHLHAKQPPSHVELRTETSQPKCLQNRDCNPSVGFGV